MNHTSALRLQQLSTLSIVQPYNTAMLLLNASINSLKVIQRNYRTADYQAAQVLQIPDAAWFAHYE